MNELATTTEAQGGAVGMPMMLNAEHMRALIEFSEVMADAVVTVPDHLRGKPADCMAIAMQAAQWGMNPFAVAQKTHIVSGRLGYEAQLVNAVISSSGAIEGVFSYEFKGAGSDIECRVGARPRGLSEIVWGEWLRNGDVQTRNSPLWKVNPKQQLAYLQVKNWARLYCPGAILGVYTDDELGTVDADTGEVVAPRGPRRRSETAAPAAPLQHVEEVPRAEQQARTVDQAEPAAPAAPKAAAAPPVASPSAGGITGGQVNYLRNKLKGADIAESSICDRFQVTSIELLGVEQFDTIKAELLALA
jgi:hypothetical protein